MKRWYWILLVAACHGASNGACHGRAAGPTTVALHGQLGLPDDAQERSGLEVSAIGPTPKRAVTDSTGAYYFTDLAPGAYEVCAVVPASAEGESCVSVVASTADTTAPPLVVTTLGDVTGQFLDDKGAPIAGVAVSARGETPLALSDEAGRFALYGVRTGARQLYAARAGYLPLIEAPVAVSWRAATAVDPLTLATETQPVSVVEGTIQLVGEPSTGLVSVTFEPSGGTVTCDDSGHFATSLPTGVYAMTIAAPARRFDIPRLLVGDGHAYVVDASFQELGALRIPVGDRLPSEVKRVTPLGDGTLIAKERTTNNGVLALDLVESATGVVCLSASAPPPWPLVYVDEATQTAIVRQANPMSSRVDFSRVALGDCSVGTVIAGGIDPLITWPSSQGGAILAFDWTGTLRRVSDGQAVVSYGPVPTRVAPLDASRFSAFYSVGNTLRLEARALADGALLAVVEPVGSFAALVASGDRLFVVDAGLFSVDASGKTTRLVEHVNAAESYGELLLLRDVSSSDDRLYRPSDGHIESAAHITVLPPLAFLTNADYTTVSVRRLDAPEVELFALPTSMRSAPTYSKRFYLVSSGATDLGSTWRAIDPQTASVVELGFGASPLDVGDRFFLIGDRVGSGSPGTLHARGLDGVDTIVATGVTTFSVSPGAKRVAYDNPALEATALYVQNLETGKRQWLGFGRPGVWLSDDQLTWVAPGATLATPALADSTFIARVSP